MDSISAERLKRAAAAASLTVAILLTALKLTGAILTGSVAILASLVDSLADIAGSAVTVFAVRVAATPPDPRHRFGHGKAESLSALTQGAIVAGSGVFVLVEAADRLVTPKPVASGSVGLAIMLAAIFVTLALIAFQRYVVRQTGSQAISADTLHYESDLLTGVAVIVSLVLSEWGGFVWADPLIAAAVAAYLLAGAARIIRSAVHTLMDHELPTKVRERIKTIVNGHPEVVSLHDLRTREAAGTQFIEFHIELDGDMSVRDAHHVTDALEAELGAAFPEAEIIIHQEPAGLEDARLDDRIHSHVSSS
jgi:ferrous-iron efflux pump FieF